MSYQVIEIPSRNKRAGRIHAEARIVVWEFGAIF